MIKTKIESITISFNVPDYEAALERMQIKGETAGHIVRCQGMLSCGSNFDITLFPGEWSRLMGPHADVTIEFAAHHDVADLTEGQAAVLIQRAIAEVHSLVCGE